MLWLSGLLLQARREETQRVEQKMCVYIYVCMYTCYIYMYIYIVFVVPPLFAAIHHQIAHLFQASISAAGRQDSGTACREDRRGANSLSDGWFIYLVTHLVITIIVIVCNNNHQ